MRRALVLLSIVALAGVAPAAAAHAAVKLKVVVTANGKPVACKIHVQVFFNGFSVGEVGTHVLKTGIWKETIPAKGVNAFPPAAVGQHVVWHAIATAKGYGQGIGTFPVSVIK